MNNAKKYWEQAQNDPIGFINKLIDNAQNENFYLDYKCANAPKNKNSLHGNDLKNIEKAASGFANTSGGIIVWGIKCDDSTDNLPIKELLPDALSFNQTLLSRLSTITYPPVDGIDSITAIESGNSGFVITYIPESYLAPHRINHQNCMYYMRVGESFNPVPHEILSGLFGKKPNPSIGCEIQTLSAAAEQKRQRNSIPRIDITIRFMLKNIGIVIANDCYLNVNSNYQASHTSPNSSHWDFHSINKDDTNTLSGITKQEVRIAPAMSLLAQQIKIVITTAPQEDLRISTHCGCDGSIPEFIQYTLELKHLLKLQNMSDQKSASKYVTNHLITNS